MNLPTTLTGITIIGSTLHWDIYPQLNIVKIPLKKLFSLVLTIHVEFIRGFYRFYIYSLDKCYDLHGICEEDLVKIKEWLEKKKG